MNTQTGNLLMFAVSLLAAVCSLCLYVPAVLYRARAGSRSLVLSFLVLGAVAVVMLVRLLRGAA